MLTYLPRKTRSATLVSLCERRIYQNDIKQASAPNWAVARARFSFVRAASQRQGRRSQSAKIGGRDKKTYSPQIDVSLRFFTQLIGDARGGLDVEDWKK